jgi:hypothetical protein
MFMAISKPDTLFSTRAAVCCFAFVAVLALTLANGCGGGGVSSASLATPQTTLDTVKKAVANEDFGAFAECLTDEALGELAGTLRMACTMFKAFAGMASAFGGQSDPAAAELSGDLDKLLSKHVGSDATPPARGLSPGTADERRAAMREAAKPIRDQKAFVADAMELLVDFSKSQSKTPPPSADFQYSDVAIEGDIATATVSGGAAGKGSPIKLRRVDGLWKIDDMGAMSTGIGPGPAMPAPQGPDGA